MRRLGLLAAGGLFYAAPIGAGATGAPYLAVLAFVPVFYFWLILMRDDSGGSGMAQVGANLLTHLALASACLGAGYAIRAVFGITLTAPLLTWLSLGLFALICARLIWPPSFSKKLEDHADEAITRLETLGDSASQAETETTDLLAEASQSESLLRVSGQLDALPAEGASGADIARIVLPAAEQIAVQELFDGLAARARRTKARRDRHAALLVATQSEASGGRHLTDAFDLIVDAADTATLALFLDQAFDILDRQPDTTRHLPPVARLLDISGQLPQHQEELSDALVELAQRIEDLERGEDE